MREAFVPFLRKFATETGPMDRNIQRLQLLVKNQPDPS